MSADESHSLSASNASLTKEIEALKRELAAARGPPGAKELAYEAELERLQAAIDYRDGRTNFLKNTLYLAHYRTDPLDRPHRE